MLFKRHWWQQKKCTAATNVQNNKSVFLITLFKEAGASDEIVDSETEIVEQKSCLWEMDDAESWILLFLKFLSNF